MLINSPISFGELIDKLTILSIKLDKVKDEVKLNNIAMESNKLNAIYEEAFASMPEEVRNDLVPLLEKLKDINNEIWSIEDNIRECERNKQFDQRFIELARSVYLSNDHRALIKKQINIVTKSSIVEEKSYKEYQ